MSIHSLIKKILLSATLLLFAAINSYAQNIAVENFIGNAHLPSNELHGIEEDEEGNKWVASDAGLVCITGNNVKVYTRKDGLASDVVLKIYKDRHNRIWIGGPNLLSLIVHGKVINIPANEELKLIDPSANGFLNLLCGADSCLYGIFSDGKSSVFKISADLKHADIIDVDKNQHYLKVLFPFINITATQKQQFIIEASKIDTNIATQRLAGKIGFTKAFLLMRSRFWTPDSSLYVSRHNVVLQFKNFVLQNTFILPNRVYCFSLINDRVVAGVLKSGFHILDHHETIPVSNAVSKTSITSFLHDREGNCWITTLEKGLFVARNTKLFVGYDNDDPVNKFIIVNDSVNLLLDNNNIISFSGRPFSHPFSYNEHINDIVFTRENEEDIAFITSQAGLAKIKKGKAEIIIKGYLASHLRHNTSTYIFWGSRNLLVYTIGKKYFHKLCPDKILCVASLSDSILLAGTFSSGLLRINISDSAEIENTIIPGRINCIARVSKNLFAVGTNKEGIHLIDNKGTLLKQYKNLPGKIQVLVYKDSLLFAGTKEGLFVINLENNSVVEYNNSNLLPFDEIIDIVIKDKTLFLAGKNMAVTLPLNKLPSYQPFLKIAVASVAVNNELFEVSMLKDLSHQLNNFSFVLNNYSYRSAQNTIYHYSVMNKEKPILYDSSITASVKFSLEPGSYEIKLYAEDKLLHTRSNNFIFPVSIKAPFYSEWWFLMLVLLSFALLCAFITIMIVKRIKARELQKRNLVLKIADLEARALQGQMNPHFVFNAVNSVQDFILSNKTEEAHLFLSAFARLIRMVLEHNRKKNVCIEEEIELLRLYVSIEEQRIKDDINLEIKINDNVDVENILLPSMLLQPLIENAIWHGLNNKPGEKTISIHFEATADLLKIEIRDNGKGMTLNECSHPPVGLTVVKERTRLTYEYEPATDFFSIENRDDGSGVLVKIILPLQTEY